MWWWWWWWWWLSLFLFVSLLLLLLLLFTCMFHYPAKQVCKIWETVEEFSSHATGECTNQIEFIDSI